MKRTAVFKNLFKSMATVALLVAVTQAHADGTADVLVRQISVEVIETAKSDKAIQGGDLARISALVESKVMPHVNFEVVTRSAVGPQWRSATPEQRGKLQAEFKTLLVRVYAGAISQLRDQTVEVIKDHRTINQAFTPRQDQHRHPDQWIVRTDCLCAGKDRPRAMLEAQFIKRQGNSDAADEGGIILADQDHRRFRPRHGL